MKPVTFISHKKEDASNAQKVYNILNAKHGISCYLDVLDEEAKDGPSLTDYLKDKLRTCNNLIAVVSTTTQASWWVPWEIGVASERNYPLATFAIQPATLPTFLKKWPYLSNDNDLDKYAQTIKEFAAPLMESMAVQKSASKNFFETLNKRLGR
ncbi:MAG: toll/interleukin-1 receptor domain-containing protein [Alphaproteobacteria bacterium]|nr:toll/interleukin-1 receptor domain-containing protein [Alphaproteobacteria bacterium]